MNKHIISSTYLTLLLTSIHLFAFQRGDDIDYGPPMHPLTRSDDVDYGLVEENTLAALNTLGMESPTKRRKVELYDTPDDLCFPRELTLLEPDEQISDELLFELNPGWLETKRIVDQAPDFDDIPEYSAEDTPLNILRDKAFVAMKANPKFRLVELVNNKKHDMNPALSDYQIRRTLLALSLCLVPEANDLKYRSELFYWPLHENDLPLAAYFLTKTKPRKVQITSCKTAAMANLLVNAGLKFPENMLHLSVSAHYGADFMQFLLDHEFKPSPQGAHGWTPLHRLMRYLCQPLMIEKAYLLMQAGNDVLDRAHKGGTVLHRAIEAMTQSAIDYNRRIEADYSSRWCIFWVDHFLEQHQGILQFLCYLKKYYYRGLYLRRNEFFAPYLEYALPLKKLHMLLSAKDDNRHTPCDLVKFDRDFHDQPFYYMETGDWEKYQTENLDPEAVQFTDDLIELLDPKNCSYDKLRELRNRFE